MALSWCPDELPARQTATAKMDANGWVMELSLIVNNGAAVSTEQAEDSVVRHVCARGISGICPVAKWMVASHVSSTSASRGSRFAYGRFTTL